MLPGLVSPNVLHNLLLWITLAASEVVGTENRVTSILPVLPKLVKSGKAKKSNLVFTELQSNQISIRVLKSRLKSNGTLNSQIFVK